MRGKVCTRLQLSGRSFFGCRWKLCRTIAMPVLPQGSNFWRVWNHSQRVYNLVSSITLVYFRLLLPTVFKIYKQPFFATGVFALNGTTRWVGSSCPVYCIYASADSVCLTVWSQCLSPAPMLTARLNQCFVTNYLPDITFTHLILKSRPWCLAAVENLSTFLKHCV